MMRILEANAVTWSALLRRCERRGSHGRWHGRGHAGVAREGELGREARDAASRAGLPHARWSSWMTATTEVEVKADVALQTLARRLATGRVADVEL